MRQMIVPVALLLIAMVACSKKPAPEASVAQPQTTNVRLAVQSERPAAREDEKPKKAAKKDKKSKGAKNLPPGWHGDYEQALAQAKMTGQPLLVLFH
ncbi:MAG: thioredoxin family protein [Gemmataceae bacterium]|nr:thioredoxin family protein [Gemmataceae bacterium]